MLTDLLLSPLSLQVWSLYLDLEESLGTVETTKAAYDRALEIKVPLHAHPF